MREAGFRPPNRHIAILFIAFVACSLTLLGYDVKVSRLETPDTSDHLLVKSIRMDLERAASSVQVDDTENIQIEHAPDAVTVGQVPALILPPQGGLPNLQLDLVSNSSYRRPPPACQ